MKHLCKPQALPVQVLILGLLAALTRTALYLFAMDEKGLPVRGHVLSWLLWALCLAAGALIFLGVRPRKGSNRYSDNFSGGIAPAAGCWIMAAGLAVTAASGNSLPRPALVLAWQLCGWLSAAAMVWAGIDRLRGKRPHVLTHALMCLFLALQLVSRYQPWSGDPRSINWIFSLLGTVALTLTAYQHSAFGAGSGHRRMLLGTGLAAVFFCAGALAHTEYVLLYLCGGIWAFLTLCRVMPEPRRKAAPTPRTTAETE